MKPNDFDAFAALLKQVAEYYRVELVPGAARLYWQALSTYDFEEVKGALTAHLHNPDTGQFMPKIADVVKLLEGNTLTQAMRAWQKVTRAITSVGTYQSVVFDDAIIHAVIDDMGGWTAIGLISEDELPFRVREFEKRYQSYRLKPPTEYPRKLCGILEANNTKGGYDIEPPVLIGDQRAARLVYDRGAETTGIQMQRLQDLTKQLEHAQ